MWDVVPEAYDHFRRCSRGEVRYFDRHNRLHRADGPAVVWPDGTTEWWRDGFRHRVGGPAIEYAGRGVEYWFEGRRHRLDGPAVVARCGVRQWWVDGEEVSESEYVRRSNQ